MQEGHMQESAPQGVADGIPAAAQGASRATVEPFLTERISLPSPHYPDRSVKATVWCSRDGSFSLQIASQVTTSLWTTAEGMEALIGVCREALDRARA